MVYPTTDTQRGVTCTDGVLCGSATEFGGGLASSQRPAPSPRPSSSTEASTASANGASATTTAPTGSNEWALAYTGGTAGPANPSLEPIVIGYVNQEGGVAAFPEATPGTKAAVNYVNKELGGIGGHPIELKSCRGAGRGRWPAVRDRDGQRPTGRAVLTGVMTVGNDSLYKIVAPKHPVIVANPVSNPDFLTPGTSPTRRAARVSFRAWPSSSPSTSARSKPIKKVAVVYGDNESRGRGEPPVRPGAEDPRRHGHQAVQVSDTATAPDVQAALQAAGRRRRRRRGAARHRPGMHRHL